ncbi:MAG: GTP cyclohydrolase I FolE [Rhodobiaceae bacterium]|jgi:GTP cyclohydrolase I|nr:GTP cyclohydrolase I FolE [Rhodobiaceae bacterium]|tara:strand:- start:2819 stop:3427 length:609 start_codon:yes stop_codon:yes gene_type:complete
MEKDAKITNIKTSPIAPTREEAEDAVRTILSWIGENPDREGLVETPRRFIDAYAEYFNGYNINGEDVLKKTFGDVGGYNDIVLLKDIAFNSFCEHHMAPFIGKAHVAYLPSDRVVGISKLARLVDVYAHRLQTQETMTAEITNAIDQSLKPRGVAVILDAEHMCMSLRGVHKHDVSTITTRFTGEFDTNENLRERFMKLTNS